MILVYRSHKQILVALQLLGKFCRPMPRQKTQPSLLQPRSSRLSVACLVVYGTSKLDDVIGVDAELPKLPTGCTVDIAKRSLVAEKKRWADLC